MLVTEHKLGVEEIQCHVVSNKHENLLHCFITVKLPMLFVISEKKTFLCTYQTQTFNFLLALNNQSIEMPTIIITFRKRKPAVSPNLQTA